MATFITIGHGDRAGYEQTDPAVPDAAHAHDALLRANGALIGVAGDPVQVRNHDDAGVRTAAGRSCARICQSPASPSSRRRAPRRPGARVLHAMRSSPRRGGGMATPGHAPTRAAQKSGGKRADEARCRFARVAQARESRRGVRLAIRRVRTVSTRCGGASCLTAKSGRTRAPTFCAQTLEELPI